MSMKYTLRSSDNESFEVDEAVAMMSRTIKHIIDDNCFKNGITLPNVSSEILSKVIEYCTKHTLAKKPEGDDDVVDTADAVDVVATDMDVVATDDVATDATSSDDVVADLKAWDMEFINVDQPMLFDLIMAENYLDIKELMDLACQTVAELIKDMKVDEVRTMFNVTNDYTKEEEEACRKENALAFEYMQSAPVNIPVWPKSKKHDLDRFLENEDDDGDVDKDEKMVLPLHEIVARSQTAAFSVFEGVGRTLKGRDLRRVRNAVFQKTGFLD